MAARVRSVRGRAPRQPEPGDGQDDRSGDAARRFGRPCRRGTAGSTRSAPHTEPHRAAAAHAPGLVAGEPAEAVVPQDQVEQAVVLGPTDVGPGRRRDQLHGGHPPPARHHQGGAAGGQLGDPAAQRRGTGQQIDGGQHRHHDERLEHLGHEPETDQASGEHHPPGPAVLDGPDGGVGGPGEQQHQEGVGVVEAEHEGCHRCERQHRPGDQGGGGEKPAPHRRRRGGLPWPRLRGPGGRGCSTG